MSLTVINSHRFLWTPEQTTPALWLDASDSDTITEVLGVVSQWDDKSVNGRNATQTTESKKPTVSVAAVNGLDALDFDGGDDGMDVDLDWTAGVSHTAFIVCERDGNGSNLYGAATGSQGAASIHIGYHQGTGTYRMNYWANDWYPSVPAGAATGYNVIMFKWTYNSRKDIRSNGGDDAGIAQAGSPIAPSGGGRIADVVGQTDFGGRICEMVFFASAVNDTLRDMVEGYLAWKWGQQSKLDSGHAYKNEPPVG